VIRSRSRAFTLLEVLVAIAILALSLSSLLASQMQSTRASLYAQQLTAASFLAEYQLIEIEWEMKRQGWQSNDVEFEGDFSDQGWPDLSYSCIVDFIEMPEYSELAEAKNQADRAGDGGDYVVDAGDRAFGAMGMVWPIVKGAIENSIRKSSCTVTWMNGRVVEELTVETFWTDETKLDALPSMGGAAESSDVDGGAGGAGAGGTGGGSRGAVIGGGGGGGGGGGPGMQGGGR